MKSSLTLFLVSFCFFVSAQQNYMSVNDPQWWGQSDASIENVEIKVEAGITHANIQIAFDLFTEEPWYYNEDAQLEYVLGFIMDKDVVFNDSWLWIEDYISKGEIYEVNEGTQIYEDIVDRRQDPSILTKHSSTRYSLRVYPLFRDSTRRVMLSYQQPLDFSGRDAEILLPFHILYASYTTPENIKLSIHDSEHWSHFELDSDHYELTGDFNTVKEYSLTQLENIRIPVIRFMPFDDSKDVILGYESTNGENYFELVFYPEVEMTTDPRYIMVVLDHAGEPYQSSLTESEILDILENHLVDGLNDIDYVNICYNDFVTQFANASWVEATDDNVRELVSGIRSNGLDNQSRLRNILPDAINHVRNETEQIQLVLLSADVNSRNRTTAEEQFEQISSFVSERGINLTLSVVDYADRNRGFTYVNGTYYSGNLYLYSLLTQEYNGQLYSYEYGDHLTVRPEELFSNLPDQQVFYDLDLDVSNGFTYNKYTNIYTGPTLSPYKPIILTGRYVGEFPMELEFVSFADGNVKSQTVTIEEADAIPTYSQTSKILNGHYLLNNEFSGDNFTRNEVIAISTEERLLSAQTIFLCLEQDTTSISSGNTGEDNVVTSVEEKEVDQIEVNVYPNPFSVELNIEITNDVVSGEDVRVELYDARGQRLNVELIQEFSGDKIIVRWQPDGSIMPGVYLIRIASGSRVIQRKVVYLG